MKKVYIPRVCFYLILPLIFWIPLNAQPQDQDEVLARLKFKVSIEKSLTTSFSRQLENYHKEYFDYLKHDFSGVENRTQKYMSEINDMRAARKPQHEILIKELEFWRVKRQELTAKMSTYQNEDAWAWDNIAQDYLDMVAEDVVYIVKNINWKEVFKPLMECITEFKMDKCKDVQGMLRTFALEAIEKTWKKNFIDDMRSELNITEKIAEDIWDSYVIVSIKESDVQKLAKQAVDSLTNYGEKKLTNYLLDKVTIDIDNTKLIGKSKEESMKYLNDQAKEAAEKRAKSLFAATAFASDIFWKFVNIYSGLELVDEMKPTVQNRMVWVREAAGCSNTNDPSCVPKLNNYYLNDKSLRKRLKRLRGEKTIIELPKKPGQNKIPHSEDERILVSSQSLVTRGVQSTENLSLNIQAFASAYEEIYDAIQQGRMYHLNYYEQSSAILNSLESSLREWKDNYPRENSSDYYEAYWNLKDRIKFDQEVVASNYKELKFDLEQLYIEYIPLFEKTKSTFDAKKQAFNLNKIKSYTANGDHNGFYSEKSILFEKADALVELRADLIDVLHDYYESIQELVCNPDNTKFMFDNGIFVRKDVKTIYVSAGDLLEFIACDDMEIPLKWLDFTVNDIMELSQQIGHMEEELKSVSCKLIVDINVKDKPVNPDLSLENKKINWSYIKNHNIKSQVEDNFEELSAALNLYKTWLEQNHDALNQSVKEFENIRPFYETMGHDLANLEYMLEFGILQPEQYVQAVKDTLNNLRLLCTDASFALDKANFCYQADQDHQEMKEYIRKRIERFKILKETFGTDYKIERLIDDISELESNIFKVQREIWDKFMISPVNNGFRYTSNIANLTGDDWYWPSFYRGRHLLSSKFIKPDEIIKTRMLSENRDSSVIRSINWVDYYPEDCNFHLFKWKTNPTFTEYLLERIGFQLNEDDMKFGIRAFVNGLVSDASEFAGIYNSNLDLIPSCQTAEQLHSVLDRLEKEYSDEDWKKAENLKDKLDIRRELICMPSPYKWYDRDIVTHWYIDTCIFNALNRFGFMKYAIPNPYFDLNLNGKPMSKWKEEWPDHNSIKIVEGNGKIKFSVDKVSPLLKNEIEKVQWRVCKQPLHTDMKSELEEYQKCIDGEEYSLVAYQRADFTQTSQLDPDYIFHYDYRVVKKDGSIIVPTGSPIYIQWWKDNPDDFKPPEVIQEEGKVVLECFHGEDSYWDGYEFDTKLVQRTSVFGIDQPEVKPDIYFCSDAFASNDDPYKLANMYDYGQKSIDQVNAKVPANDPKFKSLRDIEIGHTYGYYTVDGRFILLEILDTYQKPYDHSHLKGLKFKWRSGEPSSAGSVNNQDNQPKDNLVINGSFETPVVGSYQSFNKGQDIGAWTVINGSVDLTGSYFKSADGSQSLDLHGTPGFGGVRQSIKTIPAQEYVVEFKMAGNPVGVPTVKILQVSTGGQSKTFEFDCTGKTVQEMGWKTIQWKFTANSKLTTLSFVTLSTTGVGNCGPVIDDVKVFPASGGAATILDPSVKNISPHAQLAVTTVSGGSFIAPVYVQFNPQGSYDPDGNIILYELDKDGDGHFEVSEQGLHGASMEFTEPGTYTAVLRVTDDKGETKMTSHTFQIMPGSKVVDDSFKTSGWNEIKNWKGAKNGQGQFSTLNDELCIESMKPGGVWYSTTRPYPINQDYTVEFEVKLNTADNHFIIIYSDGFVGIDIDWGTDLGHTQPGASYNLRNGLGNLNVGKWHKIRAEAHVSDNSFDLFFDGNKVSTATGIMLNHEYHTNTTNKLFDGDHDIIFIGDVDDSSGTYNRGSACWRNFKVSSAGYSDIKGQVNSEPGPDGEIIEYEVRLELNKTTFAPGEKIKVNFDRGDIGDKTAWLGVVPSSISHDSEDENERFSEQKKRVKHKDGRLIFNAPDEVGLYDVRFHDKDDEGKEIASASFMVLEEGKAVDHIPVKEVQTDETEQDYGPIIFKFSPLRIFEGLAHVGLEYELMKYFSVEADFGYYFKVPPILYHEPLIPMKEIFDNSDEPWNDLWDLAESYTYWPLSDFWQKNSSGVNLTGAFKYYFDGQLKGGYISGEYRYKKSSWSSEDDFDEGIEFDVTANAFNIVLGKQRQINNSVWSDVFIGWGIRDVKLETNFGGDPYEEKFYYNVVLGWKLGIRF